MKGEAFRAWREAQGLTQDEAAARAGVSRQTIIRAERAGKTDVAFKLAEITLPDDFDTAAPSGKARRAAKVKDSVRKAPEVTAELKRAMLRNPPYATTSAEARAMRELRAEQRGVALSHIRLLPLQPDWRRLESGRAVNAAIPQPVDAAAPDWAGPRGVLTTSGAVYDYESAHLMRPPQEHGVAMVTAGDW